MVPGATLHSSSQVAAERTLYTIHARFLTIPITHIAPELPCLHHIKSLRKDLHLGVSMTRLPGPFDGYYLNIREVVTKVLTSLVGLLNWVVTSLRYIHIFITIHFSCKRCGLTWIMWCWNSGDGTKFGSISPFVLLTLSFPDLAKQHQVLYQYGYRHIAWHS